MEITHPKTGEKINFPKKNIEMLPPQKTPEGDITAMPHHATEMEEIHEGSLPSTVQDRQSKYTGGRVKPKKGAE